MQSGSRTSPRYPAIASLASRRDNPRTSRVSWSPANRHRAAPWRLPAEVLLDAYSQVTKIPEKFEGYPVGTRGMQLPDTAVKSYFLTAFGRPLRQQTRESERTSVPTITQALHIINGDTLNNKLRAPGNSLEMLIRLGFSDEQIVDYLYLVSFSRHPSDSERLALIQALAEAE